MQYSPWYLIQAKNKLKLHSVSMVYSQNKDVAIAVKNLFPEMFLSIKIQMVKKIIDTVFHSEGIFTDLYANL